MLSAAIFLLDDDIIWLYSIFCSRSGGGAFIDGSWCRCYVGVAQVVDCTSFLARQITEKSLR